MEISGKYISKSRDVTYKEMDAKSVLLDLESGSYYTLNEMGNFVWSLLDGKTSPAQLVKAVTETYDIDSETAGSDVTDLILRLRKEGLIQLHDGPR